MKIYADRVKYGNELYRYVGKDIWVRVLDRRYGSTPFIRIIKTLRFGDSIVFNKMPDVLLDEYFSLDSDTDWCNLIQQKEFIHSIREVTLFQPLEALTTDEVLELIKDRQNI